MSIEKYFYITFIRFCIGILRTMEQGLITMNDLQIYFSAEQLYDLTLPFLRDKIIILHIFSTNFYKVFTMEKVHET